MVKCCTMSLNKSNIRYIFILTCIYEYNRYKSITIFNLIAGLYSYSWRAIFTIHVHTLWVNGKTAIRPPTAINFY